MVFIQPDLNTFANLAFLCCYHEFFFIPFQVMLLRSVSLILLLLFSTLVATELELKNCFGADGTPVITDAPCDPTANVSSCCGLTWSCATNMYCQSPSDSSTTFVGTCTDRTWKDPACPFPLSKLSSQFRSHALSLAAFVGTCTDRTWKDPACPFPLSKLSSQFRSHALSLAALLKTRPCRRGVCARGLAPNDDELGKGAMV